LAKEIRAAQVERIQEMFRKCDKDGSNKLDSGAELRSLVQMWYVPTEDEVNGLMARFGDKAAVSTDEYVNALVGVHGEMKVEPALVTELKAQFDQIASGEPKSLPTLKVRELVLSTYLAPQDVVDKFIAIIDEEKKGHVVITQIIEAYSALEQAFPEIFARLRQLEENRAKAARAAAAAAANPQQQQQQQQAAATTPAVVAVAATPQAEVPVEAAPVVASGTVEVAPAAVVEGEAAPSQV